MLSRRLVGSVLTVLVIGLAVVGIGSGRAYAAGCSGSDCFQETASPASVAAGGTYTFTATSASCRNGSDQISMAVYDGAGSSAGQASTADPNGGPLSLSVQIPSTTVPSEGQVYVGCSSHPTELQTDTVITNGSKISIARLAGATRDLTGVAASRSFWPVGGSAGAVVLASDATFADALAGGPLAASSNGPLLLTPPSGLTSQVSGEIARVLPAGRTVYILGGTAGVSGSVDSQLTSMGYTAKRLAGSDRFGTAVAVADAMHDPVNVVEVNGLNFPDGLSAGAAAGQISAAVLLTNGTSQSPATAQYLQAHPGGLHVAVGGAAAQADPTANAVAGQDRYQTAALVAQGFFQNGPAVAGFASGAAFPDALSGGANMGSRGGPLLLVPPTGPLPSSVSQYLSQTKSVIGGFIYGGTAAVGSDVQSELAAA